MAKEGAGQRWGGYALESRPYESRVGDKWTGSLLNQAICRIIYWFSGLSYFSLSFGITVLQHQEEATDGWDTRTSAVTVGASLKEHSVYNTFQGPRHKIYTMTCRFMPYKVLSPFLSLTLSFFFFFNIPLTFSNIYTVFLSGPSKSLPKVVRKIFQKHKMQTMSIKCWQENWQGVRNKISIIRYFLFKLHTLTVKMDSLRSTMFHVMSFSLIMEYPSALNLQDIK